MVLPASSSRRGKAEIFKAVFRTKGQTLLGQHSRGFSPQGDRCGGVGVQTEHGGEKFGFFYQPTSTACTGSKTSTRRTPPGFRKNPPSPNCSNFPVRPCPEPHPCSSAALPGHFSVGKVVAWALLNCNLPLVPLLCCNNCHNQPDL